MDGTLVLWYYCILGLWYCESMVYWDETSKVSTNVPSEFTYIRIHMGLWYCGTLQKRTLSYINVDRIYLIMYIIFITTL